MPCVHAYTYVVLFTITIRNYHPEFLLLATELISSCVSLSLSLPPSLLPPSLPPLSLSFSLSPSLPSLLTPLKFLYDCVSHSNDTKLPRLYVNQPMAYCPPQWSQNTGMCVHSSANDSTKLSSRKLDTVIGVHSTSSHTPAQIFKKEGCGGPLEVSYSLYPVSDESISGHTWCSRHRLTLCVSQFTLLCAMYGSGVMHQRTM